MSNQHTPGPWTVRRMFQHETFQDFRIEGKDRERVLVLRGGMAPCEADARLIAAAPDLLAAVYDLLEMRDAHLNNRVVPGKPELEVVAQSRAAYAKARGGS